MAECRLKECARPFEPDKQHRYFCSDECRLRQKVLSKRVGYVSELPPRWKWLPEDGIFDRQAVDMVVIDGTVHRLTRREAMECVRRLIRKEYSLHNIICALGNPPFNTVRHMYQQARRQLQAEGFQWVQTQRYTNVQH